jgi:hypothetical protein
VEYFGLNWPVFLEKGEAYGASRKGYLCSMECPERPCTLDKVSEEWSVEYQLIKDYYIDGSIQGDIHSG